MKQNIVPSLTSYEDFQEEDSLINNCRIILWLLQHMQYSVSQNIGSQVWRRACFLLKLLEDCQDMTCQLAFEEKWLLANKNIVYSWFMYLPESCLMLLKKIVLNENNQNIFKWTQLLIKNWILYISRFFVKVNSLYCIDMNFFLLF